MFGFGAGCLPCVGPSVLHRQGGLCWPIVARCWPFWGLCWGPGLLWGGIVLLYICIYIYISILDVEEEGFPLARAIGFGCFSGQSERKSNMDISSLYVEKERFPISRVIGFGFVSGNQGEDRNVEGINCLG